LHKHRQHLLRKKKPSQQPQHQLLVSQPIKRPSLLKATLKKQSLLRSNPSRSVLLTYDDYEFEIEFDDSIHRSYSRPRLEEHDEDNDLPEYIRWRLFLARQLALLHYRKIWA
jgi:hypothetical protein